MSSPALGIAVRAGVHDTMLESYVFEAHKAHSLESLAFRHLGRTALTYEEVCGKGVNQIPFAQVSVERATAYAAEDADMALHVHQALCAAARGRARPRRRLPADRDADLGGARRGSSAPAC